VLVELAIALAFSALALALRWPYLQDIPRLTDETGEVATALAIVHDGARPLVHNDAYRGPAWAYLMAGALALAGPGRETPRLVAALLAALTAGATYLLARALADRRAGAVAALLVTTAFGPVVLLGHVAWSNHATPLWVTLAAVATWLGRGAGRAAGLSRVAAGILWAIALQSHPAALAPLLGAAGWWLSAPERRAGLRRSGPWLALGAFLLVMSPLAVYNVRHPLASVAEAGASGQPLSFTLNPLELAPRALALAGQLGRSAGAGPLAEPGDPRPDALVGLTDDLRPVATLAYALLLLGGLARAAWRGPRLVAWLAGATLVLLPLLNRNYTSFYDQRYVGLLLPLGAVAVGCWATDLWQRAGRPGRWALAIALAALVVYPLTSVAAYYDREITAGRTNAPYLAVADRLAADAALGERHVFVDRGLRDIDLGGGGDPMRAFVHLLALDGVPVDGIEVDELRWFLENDRSSRLWIIAGPAMVEALAGPYRLRTWEQGAGWVVLERAPLGGG
jgi:4-amino-4-deoxy-L-arabinose transferase-like glycosyltransferase